MAFTLEFKLKLINYLCQAYFFSLLFLTALVLFRVTLPAVSDGDQNTLRHLKLLTCLIFFNVLGNYICIWCKSWLSVVKVVSLKSESCTHAVLSSCGDLSQMLTFAADNCNNRHSIWNDCYIKEKCINNGPLNDKENTVCYIYADSHLEDQKLSREISNSANTKNKFDQGFTYSSSLDRHYYFNKSNTTQEVDRKSSWSSEAIREPVAVISGWSKCKDCNLIVPPRAKHCPLCGHCVLKRDHHCFFAGCCVGFHNQRFFTIFCLYAGIGEIYSSIVTLLYLRYHFEASHTWGYFAYMFPVVFFIWLTGSTSGFMVAMIVFLYWSMLSALVCCYYFCVQVALVYRGQTKYECLKGIKTYQGTVWKNITSVFGKYWLIGFIVPAPFLGYQSDGTDWSELISDSKIF